MKIDYAELYDRLKGTDLESWIEPLPDLIAHGLRPERHGLMPEWENALARLPSVEGNAVDGVWSGRGPVGGRGMGVSVQDRATAVVTHNHVTRTWKGIGVFGDATLATAEKGERLVAAMMEDLVAALA